MKKTIIIILLLSIVFANLSPVFASTLDTATPSPRYSYMDENFVSLVIDENTGIASCSADCYVSKSNYTVQVECKLQRYMGSFWGTLKTWTSTSSTGYAYVNKQWAVSSGYTYRVYATFRVWDANGNLLESDVNTYTYSYYK